MNDKIAGKFRGTGLKAGLMYGMAEFYGGGAFVIINTFFLVFLTKALGMPAALAGALDNDSIAKHYGTIYLLYSDVLLIFDVLHNHNGPLQRSPARHG